MYFSNCRGLTLEQVDPFSSLRKMWKDSTVLMLCITVFLSYLPEAGQVINIIFQTKPSALDPFYFDADSDAGFASWDRN